MRFESTVAVSLLVLLTCSPSQAESTSVDAVFERSEPASATMTLTEEGEAWRILFLAGGIPNGAATAADCELEAVGPQDVDGVISARIVPFEGEMNMITGAEIGTDAPVIQVAVGPEGVFVSDAGAADVSDASAADRFCGQGSDIEGFYLRTGEVD